ncbi:MAG: hypothetical protein HeimC2_29130 [Candidatus Heimdallarchaeota archaeon LC_2]|nr:MAG: hypothetical protein HeimC2_29130 [Candidatus Heimdallarchaeota archaeon LC_2]
MGIINKINSYSRKKQTAIVFFLIMTIILSLVGWWLISPLFLPGESLNEDLSQFDDIIPEQMTSEFTLLFTGEFVKIDNNHKGSGNIRIVNSIDGDLILIFDEVEISNGPALKVYLSSKSSFSGTGDNAGDYISLGDLRANIGNFTMEIPSNTIISNYNSVLIWCEPFAVVFTWATLISV